MSDDNPNRLSKEDRQSFLSSYGSNVHNFLEASESVDEDENKTTDIEITTDLGSTTTLGSPTSPMPPLGRSYDGKITPYDPIPENPSSESITESEVPMERKFPQSNTPLPHSDTPLPHADTPLPDPAAPSTESSDEITVHQDEDSLNTEALKQMAGVKSNSSSILKDSLEDNVPWSDGVTGSSANEEGERQGAGQEVDLGDNDSNVAESSEKSLDPWPARSVTNTTKNIEKSNQEQNLLDKVSFMESSAHNNTLMATGASIADLPLEESSVSVPVRTEPGELSPVTEPGVTGVSGPVSGVGLTDNLLEEEVDKILEEVRSSERAYSSDGFESEEDELFEAYHKEEKEGEEDATLKQPDKQLHLSPSSNMGRSPLNPLESTPIYGERVAGSVGFDLSPVRASAVDDAKTEPSTTNPDYSQEKDMAYYLAKIKAKAAQKSLEIRSSRESSKDSIVSKAGPPTPPLGLSVTKPTLVPKFVKPRTPAPKKKAEVKRSASAKSQIRKEPGNKIPLRKSTPNFTKSKKVTAASPVAAYIRSGIKPARDETLKNRSKLGNTWTAPDTDKSLVEVIQSDGDVEAWKELYKRSQEEVLHLQHSLQNMETAHKERIKTLKTAQSQELHQYKQEIYVLQSKVKSVGKLDITTDTQIALLVKQVSELETLLAGYQTENVKLYEERKVANEHQKEEQRRMYTENQALAADNVALKQILEQREASIRQLQHTQQSLTLANKVSNLPKLASLQQEVEEHKKREILYKQRIAVLESDGSRPEYVDRAVNSSLVAVDNQISALVREHTAEREQLYTKLQLLLKDNSDLKIDKDVLRRREDRISELQLTVKSLQSTEHQQDLISAATADYTRTISDLKRQISELESALHKRHPDSIAALIAAAQPLDYSNKISEMQEHLEKVKLEYEEHIAKLKSDKISESEYGKVQQMNRVLREKTVRLETETTDLRSDNARLAKQNRDLREGQIPTGHIKLKMDKLNEQLQTQDTEMTKLKSQLLLVHQHPQKQYRAEQFEGKHVSELKKEVTIFKTKCDLQKIENEQQKATLLALKVQRENEVNKLLEDNKLQIASLISLQEQDRQKMVVEHSARYAQSEVSKLQSKIETLQLQVSHYSELAAQVPGLSKDIALFRNKEERLAEQVVKLGKDLEEAQAEQPPSLHQYKTLQHKVHNLQLKHHSQVTALQATIAKLQDERVKVVIADDFVVKKFKEQIIEKNLQIEKFQNELDGIISLCVELQSHGVVLPTKHSY